jgi:hypothetical protein
VLVLYSGTSLVSLESPEKVSHQVWFVLELVEGNLITVGSLYGKLVSLVWKLV